MTNSKPRLADAEAVAHWLAVSPVEQVEHVLTKALAVAQERSMAMKAAEEERLAAEARAAADAKATQEAEARAMEEVQAAREAKEAAEKAKSQEAVTPALGSVATPAVEAEAVAPVALGGTQKWAIPTVPFDRAATIKLDLDAFALPGDDADSATDLTMLPPEAQTAHGPATAPVSVIVDPSAFAPTAPRVKPPPPVPSISMPRPAPLMTSQPISFEQRQSLRDWKGPVLVLSALLLLVGGAVVFFAIDVYKSRFMTLAPTEVKPVSAAVDAELPAIPEGMPAHEAPVAAEADAIPEPTPVKAAPKPAPARAAKPVVASKPAPAPAKTAGTVAPAAPAPVGSYIATFTTPPRSGTTTASTTVKTPAKSAAPSQPAKAKPGTVPAQRAEPVDLLGGRE